MIWVEVNNDAWNFLKVFFKIHSFALISELLLIKFLKCRLQVYIYIRWIIERAVIASEDKYWLNIKEMTLNKH